MAKQTICGVELDAFKQKPTPEEMAKIAAHWNSRQQAEFLLAWGYQLHYLCGGKVPFQWQWITDCLEELEDELRAGHGSELIRELHCRIEHNATAE